MNHREIPFFIYLITALIFSGCAANAKLFPENPVTAKDYYQRGVYFQHMALQQYGIIEGCNKAIPEFTQAIAKDPDYADAYRNRSLCYSQTHRDNEALADLTKLISLHPKEPPYDYIRRAGIYKRLGNIDGALADHDAAISARPGEYFWQISKAEFLFSMARYSDALTVYRKAFQMTPSTVGMVAGAAGDLLLTGGLVGLVFDPMGKMQDASNRAADLKRTRRGLEERIQLCEAMIKQAGAGYTIRPVAMGMTRNEVLERVLPTDNIIIEEDRMPVSINYYDDRNVLLMTFSREGSSENKSISVFVFQDDRLIADKQMRLEDVFTLPDAAPRNHAVLKLGEKTTESALQILRMTSSILYYDQKRAITLIESSSSKYNRGVVMVQFMNNKVVMWHSSPVPLF